MTTVATTAWLWHAATSPLGVACVAVASAALLLSLFAAAALVTLGRLNREHAPASAARRSPFGLLADADGTATIEFAMVLPILLFLMLVLAQTTFLMSGNLFVHYAAFAATRSAIVQIPTDNGYESANVIINGPGNIKYDAIRGAAVFALVPASGRLTTGGAAGEEYAAALAEHYAAYGQNAPAWINRQAADRLRYADFATEVDVLETTVHDDHLVSFAPLPESAPYHFGPRDPVSVRVEHRLHLGVPYIGAIFADGRLGGETNQRYTLVRAQYTLTNEGVIDALPPVPPVPRNP